MYSCLHVHRTGFEIWFSDFLSSPFSARTNKDLHPRYCAIPVATFPLLPPLRASQMPTDLSFPSYTRHRVATSLQLRYLSLCYCPNAWIALLPLSDGAQESLCYPVHVSRQSPFTTTGQSSLLGTRPPLLYVCHDHRYHGTISFLCVRFVMVL
jgi:hypothetical protein